MAACFPSQMPQSSRSVIAGWHLTAAAIATHRLHVDLDEAQIPAILEWLSPGPPNQAWRDYVSPVDPVKPDLSRLFFELTMTIAQFGGFIGFRSDGGTASWKRDGSGIKAILSTMHAIRSAKMLPGIDIHDDYDRALSHFFIATPFGHQRLEMLKEVGAPSARRYLHRLLLLAQRRDGSYRFNVLHMKGLACRFQRSFGEDPVFYKKASLLLLTMEIALNQLGQTALAETLPPADYRIPQILEGLGILKLSPALDQQISNGHIFRVDNPEVHAIRAMTIEAVGLIKASYQRQIGAPITCAELDGALYLLSRNRPLMARASMKPHMLVATAAF